MKQLAGDIAPNQILIEAGAPQASEIVERTKKCATFDSGQFVLKATAL
jgi:hypothetical protein